MSPPKICRSMDPNTLLFNSLFFHLFRSQSDSPSLSYEGNIETDRFEVQIPQCKGGKSRSREQVSQGQNFADGRKDRIIRRKTWSDQNPFYLINREFRSLF